MKFLTFNHHESYLCQLAKAGHELDVVIEYKNLDLSWNKRALPPPPNINLITFKEAQDKLKTSQYDGVICHTIKNLLWMFPFFGEKYYFIAHVALIKSKSQMAGSVPF